MRRRTFVHTLAATLATPLATPLLASAHRAKLKRIGVQLYTLRDDARKDLERTLADIAAIGFTDVELLSSMKNFGMAPAKLRQVLDRLHLRAPSTHVGGEDLADMPRLLDEAHALGHEQIVLASLPGADAKSLDGYRKWADRLNAAGAEARRAGLWIAFHDEANDFRPIDGQVPYDVLVARTDASIVRLQLDTGNLAMGGADPMTYVERYGPRYYSFHIKDAPRLGAEHDTELGKGVIDFKRLLGRIDRIQDKLLFVEQESYPGLPLDSARRDYQYLSTLAL